MQLKQTSIQAALASATEALLQDEKTSTAHRDKASGWGLSLAGLLSSPALLAAGQPGDWDIQTATLMYSESDRVTALEPVIQAQRTFENDRILSSKLVVDVLTGASANGAVPSNEFQTFTRPSGNGSFTVAPGEIVLDDTFHDTRYALSGAWTQPLLRTLSASFQANASVEYDYLSLGLGSVLNWDLNKRNTTLTAGLNFAQDSITPEGDIPTALAEAAYGRGADASSAEAANESARAADDAERGARSGSEDKTVVDLLLGITQIVDRYSLVQLNYSLSMADGYLTDPFKVVSVVDANGQPLRQLYENRPDSRAKNSLFARYKRSLRENDVLDLSYRYLWDDWDLTSHTLDARYRISFGRHFIQPHLRYYSQSATGFYQPFLRDSQAVPTEISADYRLGDMTAITAGLEYGQTMKNGHQWRIAAEYYLQSGKEVGNKPGQLANQDLSPDVDAVMLRFNYDFSL